MRHKHADLICAWANGAQIQYYDSVMCRWVDHINPLWNEETKFRIKPEPNRSDAMTDREILIQYLLMKVRQEDWHGVSDAANDLREMDAKEKK